MFDIDFRTSALLSVFNFNQSPCMQSVSFCDGLTFEDGLWFVFQVLSTAYFHENKSVSYLRYFG